MAGRGVVFSVQTPRGSPRCADSVVSFSCGAHAPLWVLKQQLSGRCGVPEEQQSLVLLTEEGDDGRLLDDDGLSLGECEIRNGSNVLLSILASSDGALCGTKARGEALDPPAPCGHRTEPAASPEVAAAHARDETRRWISREREKELLGKRLLKMAPLGELAKTETRVKVHQADHSFAGVFFDVEAKGSHELVIDAVWMGGMLGKCTVWACERSWAGFNGRKEQGKRCGWSRRNDAITTQEWALVSRKRQYQPAWDGHRRIRLDEPVRIRPGETRGLYVHSALPDDLGIQYRSTSSPEENVGESEHLRIHPGLGHTGSIPFDVHSGWLRPNRAPCGVLEYHVRRRCWCVEESSEFPQALRRAVMTMLLANNRPYSSTSNVLGILPKDVLLYALEGTLEWDMWKPDADAPVAGTGRRSRHVRRRKEMAERAEAAAATAEAAEAAAGQATATDIRNGGRARRRQKVVTVVENESSFIGPPLPATVSPSATVAATAAVGAATAAVGAAADGDDGGTSEEVRTNWRSFLDSERSSRRRRRH